MLQPVAWSSYPNSSSVQHLAQVTGMKQPVRRPQRRKDQKSKEMTGDAPISEDEANELADDEQTAVTPKQKSKTTRVAKPSKGKSRAPHNKLSSFMADARAEHILLAARKLGRERVAYISGLFAQQMDEHNTDRDELPSTSTPRTPKRGNAQVYPHFQSHTHQQAYVYLSSPAGPSPGLPVLVPIAGTWPVPRTPMSPVKPTQRGSSGATNNAHTTPLDSLVSAARSILDDDQSPSKLPAKRERAKRITEVFDSPVPKRRRVSSGGQDSSRKDSTSLDRVRSALDVLADQAAVFSSQEKERENSAESSAHELTPNGRKEGGKRTRKRRSIRLQQLFVDHQRELNDSDSLPVRYSYSANVVQPPSRSTSRTPPVESDVTPSSLARMVEIEPSSHTHFVHEDGLAAFMSPRPGSPEIVHYRTMSSPMEFTTRAHSSPGIDRMNPSIYTTTSGEVIGINSSPGYPFGYGPGSGSPNMDSTSQRGGARMTMSLSNAGTIPAKRKRTDDKRAKTPYKKWSKEEDEVLAQVMFSFKNLYASHLASYCRL
jgi:hypothetical protein